MPPPYCYDYPRPAVTVDLAVFALAGEELRVLLIRRKHDPFSGSWALPGGFLEIDEAIEDGARRELLEETGLDATGPVAFLGAYGEPHRDPRGRTISLAHVAVLRGPPPSVQGGDDAQVADWRTAGSAGPLAFDHDLILEDARDWLASGVRSGDLGLDLLPEEFNQAEIRAMHRAIYASSRGTTRWLRRMEKAGRLEPLAGSGGLYHAIKPAVTSRPDPYPGRDDPPR